MAPNDLLKRGAKCVTTVQDILDELQIDMVSEHVEVVRALPSDTTLRRPFSMPFLHVEACLDIIA